MCSNIDLHTEHEGPTMTTLVQDLPTIPNT
jgi:hypothetical protein